MIRRRTPDLTDVEDEGPKGFDDFELRLGDMMRGERATMGKSLLDVQRELRIKAAYIAAIENSDPSAFDTPGFIAGYVRSYARYLDMDPDTAFETFCKESGFSVAHGMSAEASSIKKPMQDNRPLLSSERDPFLSPNTPFVPVNDGFFSHIEPRAIGSVLILLALIGGIGYGGWTVLKQIQQVQVAPVEEAPVVLTDLDPLDQAVRSLPQPSEQALQTAQRPRTESLDRLQRPQALDVPILVARDAPISSLDPNSVGTFRSGGLPGTSVAAPDRLPATETVADAAQRLVDQLASADDANAQVTGDQVATADGNRGQRIPQVLEDSAPVLKMVAVRLSWVQVQSADGTVLFDATMQPGDTWTAPLTEEPPVLWTGDSGAIYFEVAEKFYGPVGPRGAVTRDVPMALAGLNETFPEAIWGQDQDLMRYAEAQGLNFDPDN
ncbi:MAG: helix-turn-helix domain-containing protein [Paracoccaceae bacterium]